MLEKKEIENSPRESISEIRIKKLEQAIEIIKNELSEDELNQINAIILYGSTARGEATDKSDIDIHLDLIDDPFANLDLFRSVQQKIKKIIDRELPDMAAITSKKIFPRGKIVKLICFNPRGGRNAKKKNSWKIIYAKTPEVRENLENIFQDCHQYMLQKFVHKENPYK